MDNLLIKDTMEIFGVDNKTPTNVYFLGVNSKSTLTQKLTNTVLRGALGNLPVALIQTAKDATFAVDPVLWNESIMAMLQGTTATSGTATVKYFDKGLTVGSAGALTLSSTPLTGTTVDVFDSLDTHYTATFVGTSATIPATPPSSGTVVTAVYSVSVTGTITDLNAATFPRAFTLYGHTVAFNPATDVIAADIYLVFNQAIPQGDINAALQAGKESTLPITFQLLIPINSTSFGSYINVPRLG